MSRRQLTHKQHAFLEFLQSHVRDQKVWPTYREIVDHFAYRSPNSVTQNLQALAKKGYLRRDYNGYHLVDRDSKTKGLPLRVLRDGVLDHEVTDRLSLSALFGECLGLHAVRIEGKCDHPFGEAQYVFVSEDEPGEQDFCLTLSEGALALRTVGADGRLHDPDGMQEPVDRSEVEVLGCFAGHAGSYGLMRHGATRDLMPSPTATFS